MLDRRSFILSAAALALLPLAGSALLPLTGSAWAQATFPDAPEGFFADRPLPEMEMGSPDAPVVLTEYASVTCPYCKAFHETTLPKLKPMIDAGQVRYQAREFASDPLAAAGFMLARCAPNGRDGYFGMLDILYTQQAKWTRAANPADALFELSRVAGFDRAGFEACLKDQTMLDKLRDVRAEALRFGVEGTPTLFVNGEKVEGSDFESVEKAINGKLPS